jgi:hypothetical protein
MSSGVQVLGKLEEAWLNEKHSPELLEPKMEIVDCMLEQVPCLHRYRFICADVKIIFV